jgi:hypothetical protein
MSQIIASGLVLAASLICFVAHHQRSPSTTRATLVERSPLLVVSDLSQEFRQ